VASDRVETLQRLLGLLNTGDLEAFFDAIGPDVEFTPDPSFPDADTYSGEDLRRWMSEWALTWDESSLEMLETTELERAVLVNARWHLTAAGTGQAIPIEDFYLVVWFEDGRPTRSAAFFDGGRAREVAEAPPG
jgi:ketosteroid isomerase-like protein